ncbi:MAG: helix-turn-helix domain-containing protein [Patescibacteria group bacterium]
MKFDETKVKALKDLIELLGLTQSEVAKGIEYSESSLSDLLKCHDKRGIRPDTSFKLREYLDRTIASRLDHNSLLQKKAFELWEMIFNETGFSNLNIISLPGNVVSCDTYVKRKIDNLLTSKKDSIFLNYVSLISGGPKTG